MEKIILITEKSDIDEDLVKLIRALFPECEICVLSLKKIKSKSQPNMDIENKGGDHHHEKR